MGKLSDLMATHPRPGTVQWIGLRPARGEAIDVVEAVTALADRGLDGDRAAARKGGKRQVTLVQWEHLPVITALAGLEDIDPSHLRRNVAVSGLSVFALRLARFRVGTALLEGTGVCAPCSKMEKALGPGAYNAMRGHGGITAQVLEEGSFALGDEVSFVELVRGATRSEE